MYLGIIKVWNCKWDVFKTEAVYESHKIGMICLGESPEGTVGYQYFYSEMFARKCDYHSYSPGVAELWAIESETKSQFP